MAAFKRWEDHSSAWRSKASAEGLSARRWNAWENLSTSSRKGLSQREYAKGSSIQQQTRAKAEADAVKKMRSVSSQKMRLSTIKHNVKKMTSEQLRWTMNATPEQIRRRAGSKVTAGKSRVNPWWYR